MFRFENDVCQLFCHRRSLPPLTLRICVFIMFGEMSDALDRLYAAVLVARDLDPAVSRTARLFQRGPSKMAKKLAEEAIEVVIDAVNGRPDAVVLESADLLYNLAVLWASAGVRPADVWAEMARREHLLGIAEKLPKMATHKDMPPKTVTNKAARKSTERSSIGTGRAPAVAIGERRLRKHR